MVVGIHWHSEKVSRLSPHTRDGWSLTRYPTVGAVILGLGVLVFTIGIIRGLLSGEKAPDNPWQSQSLEWRIPSPAPVDNFGEEHPKVEPDYHPYKYGAPPAF
ncbi:MAG: hypothetical protein Q9N34_08645 [Aquificota bacterium]|nr:hypothetical protein [Aquificota bacterium]